MFVSSKGKQTSNQQQFKPKYMKHAYLLLALPMAFFAAQPLFDAPVAGHPFHHGQDMIAHMPPPALAPWMAGRFDGLREERMDDKAMHTVHFNAARAELMMTTMRMARQAQANLGTQDADMDLDFQLQYGLADLGANTGKADGDIATDFSVDNQLSDLRNDAVADADINADFAADQVAEARIGTMDNTVADAEINAQFNAAK
jgi:hypothetical protein